MLVIVIIQDYLKNGKATKDGLIYLLIGTTSVMIMKSGTGIIGIFIVLAFVLLRDRKPFSNHNRLAYHLILTAAIGMTIAVVVFHIQYLFSFLIADVLHKDLTLSNRTYVWHLAFEYIRQHFSLTDYLFGQGVIEYKELIMLDRYAHCHNQFLDQFIQSGFVGLEIYIAYFYIAMDAVVGKIKKNQRMLHTMIAASIISFAIMCISEVYTTPLMYFVLLIAFHSKSLIPENQLFLRRFLYGTTIQA